MRLVREATPPAINSAPRRRSQDLHCAAAPFNSVGHFRTTRAACRIGHAHQGSCDET
jgi:hypothetical protein